jgi:hypothetical protein
MGWRIRTETALRNAGARPTEKQMEAVEYVDMNAGGELSDAIYAWIKGGDEDSKYQAIGGINAVVDKLNQAIRDLKGIE